MPLVDVEIAGRRYQLACREGEEDDLRSAAGLVDAKSRQALSALGTMSEARQLLFASLLLADQLIEKRAGQPAIDLGEEAARIARLAQRLESLAKRLETGRPNP